MDITAVTQLVGSLGFPIVMSLFLLKHNKEQAENHSLEVQELRKSIDNNTNAINAMITRLEVLEHVNRD